MEFVKKAQKFHFLALEGGDATERSEYARLAFKNAVMASRKTLTPDELTRTRSMLPKPLLRPFLRGGSAMQGDWKEWFGTTDEAKVIAQTNELFAAAAQRIESLKEEKKSLEEEWKNISKCDETIVKTLEDQLSGLEAQLRELQNLNTKFSAFQQQNSSVEADLANRLRLRQVFLEAQRLIFQPYFDTHRNALAEDLIDDVEGLIDTVNASFCKEGSKFTTPQLTERCKNLPPILSEDKIAVYKSKNLDTEFKQLMSNFGEDPNLSADTAQSLADYKAYLNKRVEEITGRSPENALEPESLSLETEGLDADTMEDLVHAICSADRLEIVKVCDNCDMQEFKTQSFDLGTGDETMYVHGNLEKLLKGVSGDVIVHEIQDDGQHAEFTHPDLVRDFQYLVGSGKGGKYISTTGTTDLNFPTNPVKVLPLNAENDEFGRYTDTCTDVSLSALHAGDFVKINGLSGIYLGTFTIPVFSDDGTIATNADMETVRLFAHPSKKTHELEPEEPFVFHLATDAGMAPLWRTKDSSKYQYFSGEDGEVLYDRMLSMGSKMPAELRDAARVVSFNTRTGKASSLTMEGTNFAVRAIERSALTGGDNRKTADELAKMLDAKDWDGIKEEMANTNPGDACRRSSPRDACFPPNMQVWMARRLVLSEAALEDVDNAFGRNTYTWFFKMMKHPMCFSPEAMPPVQKKRVVKRCREESTWENVSEYIRSIEKMDNAKRRAAVNVMVDLLQDMALLKSDSDLPTGWHRAVTEKDDTYYWHQKDDGEIISQWEKPVDRDSLLERLKKDRDDIVAGDCSNIFEKVRKFNIDAKKLEVLFAGSMTVAEIESMRRDVEGHERACDEEREARSKQAAEAWEVLEQTYNTIIAAADNCVEASVFDRFDEYAALYTSLTDDNAMRVTNMKDAVAQKRKDCNEDAKRAFDAMEAAHKDVVEGDCDNVDANAETFREQAEAYRAIVSEGTNALRISNKENEIAEKVAQCEAQAYEEGQKAEITAAIDQVKALVKQDCDDLTDDLLMQTKTVTEMYADYPDYDTLKGEMDNLTKRKEECKKEDFSKKLKELQQRSMDILKMEPCKEAMPLIEKVISDADAINLVSRSLIKEDDLMDMYYQCRDMGSVLDNLDDAIETFPGCDETSEMESLYKQYRKKLNSYKKNYPEKAQKIDEHLEEMNTMVSRCEEEKKSKKEARQKAMREKMHKNKIEKQRKQLDADFEVIKTLGCDAVDDPRVQKYRRDLQKADPAEFGSLYLDFEKWEKSCKASQKLEEDYEKIKNLTCEEAGGEEANAYKESLRKSGRQEAVAEFEKWQKDCESSIEKERRLRCSPLSKQRETECEAPCYWDKKTQMCIGKDRGEEKNAKMFQAISTRFEKAKTDNLLGVSSVCRFVKQGGEGVFLSSVDVGAAVAAVRAARGNGRLCIDLRTTNGSTKRIVEIRDVNQIEEDASGRRLVVAADSANDLLFARTLEREVPAWSAKVAPLSGGESVYSGSFVFSIRGGAASTVESHSGDLIHLKDLDSTTASSASGLPDINIDLASVHETPLHTSFW